MNTPSPEELKKKIEHAANDLPGEALDMGDDEKDTEALQRERTCTLGHNPRRNDIDN